MFDWFKKKQPQTPPPSSPEILGLRLGGAFELDDLKLRLIEPDLIIEGASRTQLIKAVGEVRLDEQTRLLRYYTDDDGFIQVLTHGTSEADVSEVKLYYFYESRPIDTQSQWQHLLDHEIVKPSWELEGFQFTKVWDNTRPVAMTEKTWLENGSVSETDQFVMIYERDTGNGQFESLLVAGEEKIYRNQAERCMAISTGFDLSPTDFKLIG
ncbi:YjfK family protein (plasmid) [Photobacterium sp. DA100]|uniref:YjfK family protein n=1 Tax=Photobacterium sp. DA100 TaxID=3027472 RepID=UPI00247ABA8F|nr:YjfK family protein [Photobacterium sp. DA100]WEM44714.1 YjfK family protein [Photobacterium sp. DA100]